MLDEATHYSLLKTLEENPGLSQRSLAQHLGVSLGKVNFCLNALIEKGSVKVNNSSLVFSPDGRCVARYPDR